MGVPCLRLCGCAQRLADAIGRQKAAEAVTFGGAAYCARANGSNLLGNCKFVEQRQMFRGWHWSTFFFSLVVNCRQANRINMIPTLTITAPPAAAWRQVSWHPLISIGQAIAIELPASSSNDECYHAVVWRNAPTDERLFKVGKPLPCHRTCWSVSTECRRHLCCSQTQHVITVRSQT